MNSNSTHVISAFVKLVAIIALFVAFYMGITRVDSYLKNKAMDDCSRVGRFERNVDGVKVYYPEPKVYAECLERLK